MEENRETNRGSEEVEESPRRILPADPSWAAMTPAACDDVDGDSSDDDSDFEFAVVGRGAEAGPADEIFSNGQILPVYPVFGRGLLASGDAVESEVDGIHIPLRSLLIEEREGRSESISPAPAAEELPEAEREHCMWDPPARTPERCRKSASTGSSRRWRLRDLVVGRSHSDGKEKFVFLNPNPNGDCSGGRAEKKGKEKEKEKEKEKGKEKKKKTAVSLAEVDMITAHRRLYGKGKGRGTAADGGKRPTYLPYRRELVGFFANVNGLSRTHHPF